jgi:hypothetical protein
MESARMAVCIKNWNRCAECLEVEKVKWVFQVFQERLNLGVFNVGGQIAPPCVGSFLTARFGDPMIGINCLAYSQNPQPQPPSDFSDRL